MDFTAILQEVCPDSDRTDEHWFEYLTQQPRLKEIVEEWALVTDALAHWSKIEGPESSEALQYRQLVKERSQEIQAFVQSEELLSKNSRS